MFVELYEFFDEIWEYDANGTLVSSSSSNDVAGSCPSNWGAVPCERTGEKQVVCLRGVIGVGGAGGAGGEPSGGGAGGAG